MTQNESEAEKERRVTKAVASDVAGSVPGEWTGSDVNLMKEMWPDLDLSDFRILGRVCMARGINPLVGDMYPMVYNKDKARGAKGGRTLVLVESIDSMRKRGHATGMVRDMAGPQFTGEDGEWNDLWLKSEHPVAARFGIWKHGMEQMVWHIRLWSEVAKSGSGDDFWRGQPTNMLGIAAERHAWRKTIPNLFAGMYGREELPPAEGIVSVEQLPGDLDPALLGTIVADEDGVIDAESSSAPDSEAAAPGLSYDLGKVLTLLQQLMVRSEPPFEWADFENFPAWPQGASHGVGVVALLGDAKGDEAGLADGLYSILTTERENAAVAPADASAASMLD